MKRPVHIAEGDDVDLLGEVRNDGVFIASAYVNCSNQVSGWPEDLLGLQAGWTLLGAAGVGTPAICYWIRDLVGLDLVGWLVVAVTSCVSATLGFRNSMRVSTVRRQVRELLADRTADANPTPAQTRPRRSYRQKENGREHK